MRIDGPASFSGRTQRARIDGGGWWEAELANMDIRSSNDARYVGAIGPLLELGIAEVLVPSCVSRTAPWPLDEDGNKIIYPSIPHEDDEYGDVYFSDGAGYDQNSIIIQAFGGPYPIRSTTMVAWSVYGGALIGGEVFSIYHATANHRRYQITTSEEIGTDLYQITFFPPLREAVAAETLLDFENPLCLMQLSEMKGADVSLELRRYARPTMVFTEADF
jgi:hypothetical protein